MRFSLRFLAAATAAAALSAAVYAQPANNACANAITITDGSVNGTTVGATNDGAGTCGASNASPDVWYRYVAPINGTLSVQTCNGTTYDSVIGIWTGCPSGGGQEIACNDDSCGLQSYTETTATAGTTYYIRVSGFSGSTGPFTLTVATGTQPASDADVVWTAIGDLTHYGPVGGIHAYALGTHTCNIGGTDLHWGNSWTGNPPTGAMNAYRLYNGR